MDKEPLIRPIECRTKFCNLVKEGDERRLIGRILEVVWNFFNEEYNLKQPRNKKPFLDAIYRCLEREPLIVRDILFEPWGWHYVWYDEVRDKKGKTTRIEVKIIKD